MICHFIWCRYMQNCVECRGHDSEMRNSINESYTSVELKSLKETKPNQTEKPKPNRKFKPTLNAHAHDMPCHAMVWHAMEYNILSSCAVCIHCIVPTMCITSDSDVRQAMVYKHFIWFTERITFDAKPFHISNFCTNILFHFYLNLFVLSHVFNHVLCLSCICSRHVCARANAISELGCAVCTPFDLSCVFRLLLPKIFSLYTDLMP